MAALTMNGGVHDTAMPRGESGNTEFRCMCHDVLIYATNLHTQDLNLKINARQSARRLKSLDEESSRFLIEVFIE